MMRAVTAISAAFAMAAAVTLGASVASASDQTDLLQRANTTVNHLRSDPAFSTASEMIRSAKAVMVVPSLVKGGFIFGAEGGNGVLLKHLGSKWSPPAFYSLSSASFGLQIGLQKAELVMIIMSDKALQGIQQGEFKIGAGAGVTVVTLSSAAEGATTGHGGDIVLWSSGTGAYGGLTLNGSVVGAKTDWNEEFYGPNATVTNILADQVQNKETTQLQSNLGTLVGM